jgi:hypothetical protein
MPIIFHYHHRLPHTRTIIISSRLPRDGAATFCADSPAHAPQPASPARSSGSPSSRALDLHALPHQQPLLEYGPGSNALGAYNSRPGTEAPHIPQGTLRERRTHSARTPVRGAVIQHRTESKV